MKSPVRSLMNNWSLPPCQRLPFFPTGPRWPADVLFPAVSQPRAIVPDVPSSPPDGPGRGRPGRPGPPAGHKAAAALKMEARGRRRLHSRWEVCELAAILEEGAGYGVPGGFGLGGGWTFAFGGRGSGRPLRTDPGVTLTAWGASGFQQRRNLKDPPCFHIGTEVRRVRLHMG